MIYLGSGCWNSVHTICVILPAMSLFHFSDDPAIEKFVPRPVRVSTKRPLGLEWLNEALVWAIDEPHEPMYLFPRECPRILIWPTENTTVADRLRWYGESTATMIAYTERTWLEPLRTAIVHRYDLPASSFVDLRDAGMWVSRTSVVPNGVETLMDLPDQLQRRGVELRLLDSLPPLRDVFQSTLHASGIRLRNAVDWDN